jgi:hypothetical protein
MWLFSNIDYKEIYSTAAITLTLMAYFPYIRSIILGKIKPHVFSWVIWGITTFVVFLAQLEDKGGLGAWPIGVSGIITLFVALLSYIKRADIAITKMDWIFFILALSSLPLWYLSSDPLWAVVILTTVDLFGFVPTIRKAYIEPYSESQSFFALFVVRNVVAIMALENYSVTTVLFPVAISIACVFLMAMIASRRKIVSTENSIK